MSLWEDYEAEYAFERDFPHGVDNDEWTTKDGRTLKVKDMTTGHIMNCMKMLMKDGEVIDDFYYVFEQELRRRGLAMICPTQEVTPHAGI